MQNKIFHKQNNKYFNIILIYIVVIVSLIFMFCCSCIKKQDENISGQNEDLIMLAENILIVIFSNDNIFYRENQVPPDIYDLFYTGQLTDIFYSDRYWIDIVTIYPEIPSPGGDYHSLIFIIILPKYETDEFYILSNSFGWPREAELRKYFRTELYEVIEQMDDEHEINESNYVLIKLFKWRFGDNKEMIFYD